MLVKSMTDEKPIRSMADQRLDFAHSTPHRKSYIVSSSYRSGSTYFCRQLWNTGVLGAPSEVLNVATNELRLLMSRFNASSPADYIAKLLAHRTSRNGVFGMKGHFPHFEAFLKGYPDLLQALSPLTFIHIGRLDKVAQAVSMAKALQTNQWASHTELSERPPLRYDRELIANCMHEVELQDAGWLRWFETQKIRPFQVTYENLIADTAGTVRSIVELLGVQNDEPSEVRVPPAEKQSDDTNLEWIARYQEETRAGAVRPAVDVGSAQGRASDAGAIPSAVGGHFFDRYDRMIDSLPNVRTSPTGFIGLIRLRRLYDAMIAQNSQLFRGARVLDIISFNGFWSLAALDAGAAHVVGIETERKTVEAAKRNLSQCGIKSESYDFINSKIFAALETFNPEQFDVILCKGFFQYCDAVEFFRHLSRLRPKHVVLDTKIAPGKGPLARFTLAGKTWKGRRGRIMSTPTHEMIEFLCEFEFRWRLLDWREMGITEWTGIHEYKSGQRRTYVLDRI